MKNDKYELPLIGTNYRWHDKRKGIAATRINDIDGYDDESPRVNGNLWFKNKPTQIDYYTDPDFAGAGNRYSYQIINPMTLNETIDQNETLVRSSFIPYIIIDEQIYWLLGSFHDFPEVKVDFGGKCRKGENPIKCAFRELREETRGVLVEPVRQALADGRAVVFKGYNNHRSVKHYDKRVIFILVNMTNQLDDLDKIQFSIDSVPTITKEKFGPLNFYAERDIFHGRDSQNRGIRLYTSYALTDFVQFLMNYYYG